MMTMMPMMVPNTSKNSRAAAASNSSTTTSTSAASNTPARPLRDEVLRNLGKDFAPTAEDTLDVDSLLCRLPYRKMLSSLCNTSGSSSQDSIPIPYVTRTYEESFMHEPTNKSERHCVKGKLCECMFIDKDHPFTCVEFLLPGEKSGTIPNMCVLCSRAVTQQLYYDIMYDHQEFNGCIQRFGNLHSQEGEYALDAMLIAAPSAPAHIMPLPIVSHQRNRYYVVVKSGIKSIKQQRVYFQSTPSCSVENG